MSKRNPHVAKAAVVVTVAAVTVARAAMAMAVATAVETAVATDAKTNTETNTVLLGKADDLLWVIRFFRLGLERKCQKYICSDCG